MGPDTPDASDNSEKIVEALVLELALEAREILLDKDHLQSLIETRLALRCIELAEHLEARGKPFVLGICGNPNRGKSTFSAIAASRLRIYGFPVHTAELDLYSPTLDAVLGEVTWEERKKGISVPVEAIEASIQNLQELPPGIAIADFPGDPEDPHQRMRAEACDLLLALTTNMPEKDLWSKLSHESGTPFLWLISRRDPPYMIQFPSHPEISYLDRTLKRRYLTSIPLTRILEVIADLENVPLTDYWEHCSEAERLVLEEILDFHFAPFWNFDK